MTKELVHKLITGLRQMERFEEAESLRSYVFGLEKELREAKEDLFDLRNTRNALSEDNVRLTTELEEIKTRIESSPKVWLWWRKDYNGEWFIKRADTDISQWDGSTRSEADRIEEIFAVPVEKIKEEKQP